MFTLTSPAFPANGAIPAVYGCTGRNLSPALTWGEPPAGTQSFALIMDDPDAPAGTFVHWVLYDIPAASRGLVENIGIDPRTGVQGRNSAGRSGYMGPCPPSGTHRYFFKLYALDAKLGLAPGMGKDALLKAIRAHILAESELMGTFQR